MSLEFDADLTLEGEGLDGEVLLGHVTGEGSTLRLTAADPGRFVRALRVEGATDLAGVRRGVERLARRGVTVAVTGPQGDVLTMGAGVDSALGRLTAGSRRIRPGSPVAVASLARGLAMDALRDRRSRLLLVAALAVVAGVARARSRALTLTAAGDPAP